MVHESKKWRSRVSLVLGVVVGCFIVASIILIFLIGYSKNYAYCPYTDRDGAGKMAMGLLENNESFREFRVKADSIYPKVVSVRKTPDDGYIWVVDFFKKSDGKAFANMMISENDCDIGTSYYDDRG